MESKEYYQSILMDYNKNRKGRSLRAYCKDEGVDYNWIQKCKREYPKEQQPEPEQKQETTTFLPIGITEEEPKQNTWEVDNLILKSPDGEFIEIKTNSLTTAAMLLTKISLP